MALALLLGLNFTNMEFKDFIGVEQGVFTPEFCQSVIQYHENAVQAGLVMTRQNADASTLKIQKDDESLYMHHEEFVSLDGTKTILKQFKEAFVVQLYSQYINQFDILKTVDPLNIKYVKVQKTKVGGGYHIWHHETDKRDTSNRVLAWMLYLNDVEEGGETEFLYQHMRVKPTMGTFVMWPAGFTHTHRGNPPLSNEKYIMTGWIEY
jgi:hypothetical protein